MKKFRIALIAILAALAGGCNQGEDEARDKAKLEGDAIAKSELKAQLDAKDQLIEKARAEGKAAAEAELATNNANLASRSREMENDLAVRHLFYRAARGTYEGVLTTERGEFRVRITLVPSLAPYSAARIRQLEEVTSDINNLFFNAHIVQWNPANRLSAVGCRVENIRPDLARGEISIASASCPNLYLLKVTDETVARTVPTDAAREVAAMIRGGQLKEVPMIQGEVHPTTNASVYKFSIQRVQR